jgi:DNA-binding NarL/FixJ family response regulator
LNTTCKIAIIEKYALFSSGIKSMLNLSDDLEVIAEGASPDVLFLLLQDQIPDIILIDMLHWVNDGIKTVKATRTIFPDIPFLLITSIDFTDCFQDYLELGVKGFVYNTDSPSALIESLKKICIGEHKLNYENNSVETIQKNHHLKKIILTDRETEVLKLFCSGFTYREIGEKLFISHRTVESHKKNILSKLNITSTAEMVKYATRNRLISN